MTTAKQTSLACWRLDGSRAQLSAGGLSGAIDLQRPGLGLSDLRLNGVTIAGRILGIGVKSAAAPADAATARWQPSDCFARGRDLVATYREPFGEPFNLQVYWRVIDGRANEPLLDAIASIQTPLWEAYPGVCIGSSVGTTDEAAAPAAWIARVGPQLSYVEISRPGDFLLASGELGLNWRFGEQFMERGVIRRLHLRAGFTADKDAAAFANRLRQSLEAEQPPLTA